MHPSLPKVLWQGDNPTDGRGHRPGVVENDPGIEKRGPGGIVSVRHRPLQVARAGELDIDVAVVGGGLGVDEGDPAGGLRRRERVVGDQQVDVNIGGGSLSPPGHRTDHDKCEHLRFGGDLRRVRRDGLLLVPHLRRPG